MTPLLAALLLLAPALDPQTPPPTNPTEEAIKRLQSENEKLRQDQAKLANDIEAANRGIAEATKAFETGDSANAKAAALETLKAEVARKLRLINVKEAKRLLAEINTRNTLAIDGFDRAGRALSVLDLCAGKAKEKAFASRYAGLANLFDVDPSARALIEKAAKSSGAKSPEMLTVVRALASGSWGAVMPVVTGLFGMGKKGGWTADTEFVVIAAHLTDAMAEANRSYKAQVDRLEAEVLLNRENLVDAFERAAAVYAEGPVSIRDYASRVDERRSLEGKITGRHAKTQADLIALVNDPASPADAFAVTLDDEGAARPRLAEIDGVCAATAISANAVYGIERGMVNALKAVQTDVEARLAGSKFITDKEFAAKATILRSKIQSLVEAGEALAQETKTTVVGPARGLGAPR